MKRQSSSLTATVVAIGVTAVASAMATAPLASQKPPIPEECDPDNFPAYVCSIEPGLTTYWPWTP